MKIKFLLADRNFKNHIELSNYMIRKYDREPIRYLAELIFRINEKIELLNERKKIEGKTEVPMHTDSIIKIFESLLK